MKRLALMLPLMLAACASKPERTPAPPLAATLKRPAETKPVDLKPLKEATRPIEEANRQLRQEIERQRGIGYELRRELAAARASLEVTQGQWDSIETRATDLETSRDVLARTASDQANRIEELDGMVLSKTIEVAEAEREKDELRATVDQANQRISALTEAAADIAAERNTADARIQSLEDDLAEKKRALIFWRFSTAVMGLAAGVLTYLLLKP